MASTRYNKTYIREWRNTRGLSVRKLADRMEHEPGVPIISFSQLARIESGKQAYTQPIIEAAAAALDVTVTDLLERNPEVDGEVIDLMRALTPPQKEQAVRLLKALAG